jgi:hypothetical protein
MARGKFNQELFDSFCRYLENAKAKGMEVRSCFIGSLLYNLGENVQKEKGIDFIDYKNAYLEDQVCNYKKAIETVFGKGSWKVLKEVNKKI